jgi:hypothetical protein
MTPSTTWRVALFGAAAAMIYGGPQHPGGTMAEMLAHPAWVRSHVWVLVGFVALLAAILLHRRAVPLSPRGARWARLAVWGTALQAVEMVFHTAAVVDHDHLVAGQSTPVLSTHLALSVVLYPLFAVTAGGWVLATARERALASPWVAWLALVGLAAHGVAAPLVVGFGWVEARILFPFLMLFAIWCVLATFWPVRAGRAAGAATPQQLGAPAAG